MLVSFYQFQFTHPGKGATELKAGAILVEAFQFTHPGKGATVVEGGRFPSIKVSIHAPWEGCDAQGRGEGYLYEQVSIHAPWEGCDQTLTA